MSGAYKYRPQYTQNIIGPSPAEPEVSVVQPTPSQRLTEYAELLADIFEGKPVPSSVNGVMGRAAFFTRDSKVAQVKLLLMNFKDEAKAEAVPPNLIPTPDAFGNDTGRSAFLGTSTGNASVTPSEEAPTPCHDSGVLIPGEPKSGGK